MRQHHLDARAPQTALLDVVSDLGGLHAQVMSSAELTAWARVEGLEPDAVARALWDDRNLVKTWAMRGTLHLLPSAEYGLWQAGMSTYRHFLKPSWSKAFGVSPEGLDRMGAAITDALDHRQLTREELAAEVGRVTGDDTLGAKLVESWGSILKPAAFRGLLCFGPSRGRNVTFARPDQWIGKDRFGSHAPVKPDDAMTEIVRRFLAVNGPATREEVARWWAMTPATATRYRRSMGDEVAEVDVEGTPAWMLAADVDSAAAATPRRTVNLLPAFDQYVIASTRQSPHLLPGPFRDRVYRPQGWISPVLLVNGRMDGVWRHERRGGRLAVTIEPFVDLAPWARKSAEREAADLGRFLDADAEVTWM